MPTAENNGTHEEPQSPLPADEEDEDAVAHHPMNTSMPILPSLDEVLACQFSSWYPLFSALPQRYRGRSNVTIKSIILLDLPAAFEDYLNTDQLILPAHTRTSSALLEHHHDHHQTDSDWSSDDDDDNDKPTDDPNFDFPELNQRIEDAIRELEGAVMPKLNWSSPRDAVWVNSGTLECRTAGDVYMLCKASDFCAHDVHHALQDIIAGDADDDSRRTTERSGRLQLALRKWCNLYPSQEFRCFVGHPKKLLAISQRHHSQHWPHLLQQKPEIRELLQEFFEVAVRDNVPLTRFVFDVYVDKKRRVWLLDLNVWASRTDALLFDWPELTRMATASAAADLSAALNNHMDLPIVRVVETDKQVRPDPLASYKAPIDTLHVASSMNGSLRDDNRFREFMDLCKRPGSATSSDDDDEDDDE